jgi:hypothetical protein
LQMFRGNLRNAIDIFRIRFSLGQLASIRFKADTKPAPTVLGAERSSSFESVSEPNPER